MIGLKKNGEEFPVEFAISTWEEGNERFYCAMMLDITNRKKLETKLKQKTEDLEMFLYRSAHDLKAPLTSAEGLLNLIKEENLDSNVKLLTDLLYKTLERGRLLVDNIAYASIIPNKANEINKIDFNALIENTLKTLSGLKNYEAIKFDLNLEQVDGFYANQELISSLFQNIIHNAIKYSKPLSSNHVPFVTIQINQLDGFVKMVIQDNGIGMDETHLKRVFDLYYRINEDYEQGSGLGLYIVKQIVDDLNGEVTVTSKINEGTSFEVILPNLKEGELNND
jgi:signal transduction histidine kinase